MSRLSSQFLIALIPGLLIALFSAGLKGEVNLGWTIITMILAFSLVLSYDYRKMRRRVWSATTLEHKLGRKFSATEWGASVPSIQDHLVFGQYLTLSPGSYTATFRLKIDDNSASNDKVAILDVVCGDDDKDAARMITKRTVWRHEFLYPDTYADFHVQFQLDKREKRVEFRVWYGNTAELVVHTIQLVPV